MGAPLNSITAIPLYRRGDLVVCPFPFSAATGFKNRPALVLASWSLPGIGFDCLICIVTSQGPTSGADPYSLPLDATDDETGLTYMRARYYDNVTGRFIGEDSARDGNNWFAYCGADPVNCIDENGKETLTPEEQDWVTRGHCASFLAAFYAAVMAKFAASSPALSLLFMAAAVIVFLAAALLYAYALGLHSNVALMFGGAAGVAAGIVYSVMSGLALRGYLESLGKVSSLGVGGVALGGAVVSQTTAVLAAIWLIDNP